MVTIEKIEIDGEVKEVEVDWSFFKGSDTKKTKFSYIKLIYMLQFVNGKIKSNYINSREYMEVIFDELVYKNRMDRIIRSINNILEFKKACEKENDKFIKIVDINEKGGLVALVKLENEKNIEITITNYTLFITARKKLYVLFDEINAKKESIYLGNSELISYSLDGIYITTTPRIFYNNTVKAVKKFFDLLNYNKHHKFIKWIGHNEKNVLIALIETTYNGVTKEVEIDISSYNYNSNGFLAGENKCYEYAKENGHKVLTPYIKGHGIITVKFKDCKHNPCETTANSFTNGQGCLQCAIENNSKKIIDRTKKEFYEYCKHNSYEIVGEYVDNSTKVLIDFKCGHKAHPITPNCIKRGYKCPICKIEKLKGENHPNWKGGLSPIRNHLREKINQWKIDSFKKYDYKCFITGLKNNLIVHHVTSFNTILYEIMEDLNLDVRDNIGKYTKEELKSIEDKCMELHYKYGLGIVLTEEIHKEFHLMYGYGDNTIEEFEEFRKMKLKEILNKTK